MKIFRILPIVLLTGCASASSIPLARDTVQINASAALACGAGGAGKVAIKQASIETINRGYDMFIVINAGARTDMRVMGQTSTRIQSTGFGGYQVSGGAPIYGGAHSQNLVVKMFKYGTSGSKNALDARSILGPEWDKVIKEKTINCLK